MAQQGLLAEDATRETIDIVAVLLLVWQSRLILLASVLAGLLFGAAYVYLYATPQYRAVSAVVLETRKEQIVDLDTVIGGLSRDLPAINTEVEILRSRRLIGVVVDQLNLVDDPEFNLALAPPGTLELMRTWVLDPPAEAFPPDNDNLRDRVVTRLKKKIEVANLPLSLVFVVGVETSNPAKSAAIADAIAQAYINQQVEEKYAATDHALGWLTERVSELGVQLESAENRLKAFRAGSDVLGKESVDASDRQLKALRARLEEQRGLRDQALERVNALKGVSDRDEKAAVVDEGLLNRIGLAAEAPNLSSHDELDRRYRHVLLRATSDAERAENRLRTLEASARDLEAQMKQQSEEVLRFEHLTREVDSTRLLYEYFLGRLKETSAQKGLQRPDSRMLSNAVVSDRPASPQKARVLGLGGVLGLFAGIALVALNQLRQRGFQDIQTIEAVTGHTVFGQVPEIEGHTRSEQLSRLASEPSSPVAEAIRNVRTSLLMARLDDPPKIVMITSSVADEGKSLLSLALAQNIAGMGQRVLLVECDLKRPSFSGVLKTDRDTGLLSVLAGQTPLENAILTDAESGLDILLSEATSPASADIFSSRQFENFIQNVRDRYDHVILDTPPVLLMPDARVVSRHVDSILFAIKWHSTTKRQVSEGLQMLRTVNANVTGLVATRVEAESCQYRSETYAPIATGSFAGPV